VHGDRSIDARTDVWAIGAVLAEMLNGERVFPGPSEPVTFVQILSEGADRVARAVKMLPPAIGAVVARAMALAPGQRFSSMQAFRRELQASAGQELDHAPQSSGVESDSSGGYGSAFLQAPPADDERVSRYRDARGDDDTSDEDGHHDEPTAAAMALEQNQLREAVGRAHRVLETDADGSQSGRMLLIIAIAQLWLGEYDECVEAARAAMERFDPGSTGWYVAAGYLATGLGSLARKADLDELLFRLKAHAPLDDDNAAHAVACSRLGVSMLLLGRQTEAEELFETVVRPADGSSDPLVCAWQDVMRSTFAQQLGDPSAYLTYAERAVESFTLKGDVRNACHQRVNVGDAFMQLGAYGRAEQRFREVLAIAEPMRLALTAPARVNLGFALARCGKLEPAHDVLALGLQQAVEQGLQRFAAAGNSYLAVVLAAAGKLDAAEAAARKGVRDASVSRSLSAAAQAILAGTLLMQERFADALEPACAAAVTLDKLGTVEEGESLIRLVQTTALATNGREEEAREAIAVASRRLRSRARRIADAAWRRSFLRNVLENARTLALLRYWTEQPEDATRAAMRLARTILGLGSRQG
jgi:tetratricopeptide (TPR) repeat protein